MILGIDHIAIAVQNIEESLKFWKDSLGLNLDGNEVVSEQQVKTFFLSAGKQVLKDESASPPDKNRIELLEPISSESAVAKFIEKKGGGGIHHIAFLVDDIEKEIQTLVSKGYQFVNTKPRCGAHNSQVAFLHPKFCDGVLIELVQKTL